MPVFVTDRTFSDEYTGTSEGNFLNGVIGDKITVRIPFYVKWSSEDLLLTFDSEDGTITRTDDTEFGSFITDGFRVDDTFDFVASGSSNEGSYTITEVYDRYLVVSESLTSEIVESGSLYGTTLVTSIDYYPNLCENDTVDFFSLSDRETKPRYTVYDIVASGSMSYPMVVGSNSKAWVTGQCDISPIGLTDYKQEFEMIHQFTITPLWLASQQLNFENGIPPAPNYYQDRLALKYIFKIDAKFNPDDPDVPHTIISTSTKGTTSWFDEKNNGTDSPYSVTSITYTDVVASGEVDAIQRCGETNVTMIIESTEAIFTANTEMVLGHFFCPKSESTYINQRTNEFKDCFRYDRALLTGTSIAVDGDEVGTDNQMLTNINVTVDSTTQITIDFVASPSQAIQDQMADQDDDDMQYSLYLTIQYVAIA